MTFARRSRTLHTATGNANIQRDGRRRNERTEPVCHRLRHRRRRTAVSLKEPQVVAWVRIPHLRVRLESVHERIAEDPQRNRLVESHWAQNATLYRGARSEFGKSVLNPVEPASKG